MNRINFNSFTSSPRKITLFELWKAYTEGLYSDTPLNRKMGRVGMSYVEYFQRTKAQNEESEKEKKIQEEAQSEEARKANLKPPKSMSEGLRKKNFSSYKKDDVLYLPKTHKTNEGNFLVTDIRKTSPSSSLIMVHLEDMDGNPVSFVKEFIDGHDPFEGFKVLDMNYSLQDNKPSDFVPKEDAIKNFEEKVKEITKKESKDEFMREDIKVALGSVPDFGTKTKNISVESWGTTIELNYKGKNQIFTIESSGKSFYKISLFVPPKSKYDEGKYEKHPDFPDIMSVKDLKNTVKSMYRDSSTE